MSNIYFSSSYSEGRRRFLSFCSKAGVTVETHVNPRIKGPAGEELATDVAWFGPPKASKAFLVSCGTHGLEAAAGAATILQWIGEGGYSKLPDDTALMVIHAVNPYGWAYQSRTNEDNIDINRNCLDHAKPYPGNDIYRDIHERVISGAHGDTHPDLAMENYRAFVEEHGYSAALNGITGGQYELADGLGYGGNQQSWSCQTPLRLIREKLRHARKIAFIDWHTGIGQFGEPFIIFCDPVQPEGVERAGRWWGEQYIHTDDIFDDAGSPDYSGLLLNAIQRELRSLGDADVLGVVIEWGTFELEVMLKALLMDRWLRYSTPDHSVPEALAMKTQLVERFYPSAPEWRRSVLAHSKRIYKQTIKGLNAW